MHNIGRIYSYRNNSGYSCACADTFLDAFRDRIDAFLFQSIRVGRSQSHLTRRGVNYCCNQYNRCTINRIYERGKQSKAKLILVLY